MENTQKEMLPKPSFVSMRPRLTTMDSKLQNKITIINPIENHLKQYIFPRTDFIKSILQLDNRLKNTLTLFSVLSIIGLSFFLSDYWKLIETFLYLFTLICFILPRTDHYMFIRACQTFDFIYLFLQILAIRIIYLISFWENHETGSNVIRIINNILSIFSITLALVSKDSIRINIISYVIILLSITLYFIYTRYLLESQTTSILELEVCSLYYSCTTIKNLMANILNSVIFLYFRLLVLAILYPKNCIFVKLSVTFDVKPNSIQRNIVVPINSDFEIT